MNTSLRTYFLSINFNSLNIFGNTLFPKAVQLFWCSLPDDRSTHSYPARPY